MTKKEIDDRITLLADQASAAIRRKMQDRVRECQAPKAYAEGICGEWFLVQKRGKYCSIACTSRVMTGRYRVAGKHKKKR